MEERLLKILRIDDASERVRQLTSLRDTQPQEALSALIRLMRSPDQTVRRRAGGSLNRFWDFTAAQTAELADLLRHHTDDRVRLSCAIHLMPLSGPAADQAFLEALQDPSEKVVQIACLEVGARGGAGAAEALAGGLRHPSWRVRLEACKSLITLNRADARVVAALEGMSREPEAAVYDAECEAWKPDLEALVESAKALGILPASAKEEILTAQQAAPWGKLDTILARARQIAGPPGTPPTP